jgi:hypothetical protein
MNISGFTNRASLFPFPLLSPRFPSALILFFFSRCAAIASILARPTHRHRRRPPSPQELAALGRSSDAPSHPRPCPRLPDARWHPLTPVSPTPADARLAPPRLGLCHLTPSGARSVPPRPVPGHSGRHPLGPLSPDAPTWTVDVLPSPPPARRQPNSLPSSSARSR